ncbi:MAG: dihydroorotase [Fusobacteriaceae bacterium]
MLLIKNAKIVVGEYIQVLSSQKKDLEIITDILINDEGIIEKIEKNINSHTDNNKNNNSTNSSNHNHHKQYPNIKIIDANFNYVIPGVIDPHTHMRDPGLTSKEDFLTGSKACAKGGITTFLDMPNTIPNTISLKILEEKRKNSQNRSYVDYGFHFGGSKNDNSLEILKVKNFTASTKLFLNMSTGDMLIENIKTIENIFKNSKLISVHAEEEKVGTAIDFSHKFNTPLYLCHLSKRSEIDSLRKAKKNGIKIFGEVTPHHLFLSQEDKNSSKINELLLCMKPELKNKDDNKALWEALKDGTIDTIGTDHAPHHLEEKMKSTIFGIPGVENSLELMLLGVKEKKITLHKLIELMCKNPAKIFNISKKGEIKIGNYGDLVIIDINNVHTINNKNVISKCGWTPYHSMVTGGTVLTTILRGDIVYSDNSFYEVKGREIKYFHNTEDKIK